MKVLFSGLILLVVPLIASGLGTRQRVIAKGRLLCGTQPASNVYVKLVDEDDGKRSLRYHSRLNHFCDVAVGPDPDDDMADVRTNANGEFRLDGTETEVTNIDPVLKIYHDCNDGLVSCNS